MTRLEPVSVVSLGYSEIDSWSAKLRNFEKQFWYPLNPTQKFRIVHPGNYATFFESMGEARCFVAVLGDEVVGVLSVTIRTRGTQAQDSTAVAYFADIKIAQHKRGSRVLLQLIQHSMAWLRGRVSSGYAVVMDGTAATPNRYTGRLGIPSFRQIGKVCMLVISTSVQIQVPTRVVTEKLLQSRIPNQCRKERFWLYSKLNYRSEYEPTLLLDPATRAHGILEDTRKAKRLFNEHNEEIMFAHLSYVEYESPNDLISIIGEANQLAREAGFMECLITVPNGDRSIFQSLLGETLQQTLTATMFGKAMNAADTSLVYSSEI